MRDLMEEAPQMLEATPDSLREVIMSVRDRRDELRAQAEHNRGFVPRWHDGSASAGRLRDFLS